MAMLRQAICSSFLVVHDFLHPTSHTEKNSSLASYSSKLFEVKQKPWNPSFTKAELFLEGLFSLFREIVVQTKYVSNID
jgi:hypothetical protein